MVPLLPMIRDSLGLDYLRAGLLLSAFSLSYGFSQLPIAALADRFSKRKVVSLGLVVTGIACILAGLSSDYVQIFASFILLGIAGSTYHAPASAFLSQTFRKDARGRSLGIHIIGGTSGLMVAPVVAILVANVTGSWRNSFMVMGLPVLVAGVLIWMVARSQDTANRKAAAQMPLESFKMMDVLRALGVLVVIALLTQLMVSAMNSFLPLYLVDRHGVPSDQAGLMMTIVYAAGVVGAPLGGAISDRIGRKPVILLSVIIIGPMMFLVTVLPFGFLLIGAIAVYGMFLVFRLPAIESLIADVVPTQRRATVLGAYYFLSQETQGISTPILGWLMDQFGVNNGFAALAASALACSVLVLLLRRKI
jgi:MFS family permease